ncbi:MAG TPA: hypothetical protein PLD27_01895 [bacterium]|nr:hypothetical protein [bacterium]HOL46704.1 hypothetical protein [bacterium]HPQ18392.1 hypothetical protein [bacterium]
MLCNNCNRFIDFHYKDLKNKSYFKCANCDHLNYYIKANETIIDKEETEYSGILKKIISRAIIIILLAIILKLLKFRNFFYLLTGVFIWGVILQLLSFLIFNTPYNFFIKEKKDKIFIYLDLIISFIFFIFYLLWKKNI